MVIDVLRPLLQSMWNQIRTCQT